MKKLYLAVSIILSALQSNGQHALSVDVASVSNIAESLNGIGVSSFYHVNEHIVAGLELNRFFASHQLISGEDIQSSATDVELNLHYLLKLYKQVKVYPITGVGHTSHREAGGESAESYTTSFWSLNTGAGMLYEIGHWAPHVEYNVAWGKHNQSFFLAGLSYELDFGRHKHQ